ncbi:MAG: pyridoxamine 5'-phosphate oxidase [Bacteroidota bacterium]|nr:pyridoxamine 5'-phosphate oxidase [Bacteroidota bacterium]
MLHDIRKQYMFSSLDEKEVLPNPIEQFDVWLDEAIKHNQSEPTAMVVSTVDENLQPHSRIVLLKDVQPEGFVFFTNYEGHKARQIAFNNQVSLLFFWPQLERQVRITGQVEKVSDAISTVYFLSRPLESRIGAWASPQSQVIRSKDFLEQQYEYYMQKFGENVPKPPHWGGYLVKPTSIEFWQGRPNRLHDRVIYRIESGEWKISRLAP